VHSPASFQHREEIPSQHPQNKQKTPGLKKEMKTQEGYGESPVFQEAVCHMRTKHLVSESGTMDSGSGWEASVFSAERSRLSPRLTDYKHTNYLGIIKM
jgi:hypothetical protein